MSEKSFANEAGKRFSFFTVNVYSSASFDQLK